MHLCALVRDVRRLAPLVEWSNSPLGGFGDRTGRQTHGESEHLRLPRDLVYHQRIGFDNTCETTDHRLPVEASVAFRQQERTYVEDTYEEVPYGSVPLRTNPPAVLQIQLKETVDRDQQPHPKPSQEQLREYSHPDDRCSDKGNPDRWTQRREETMTGDVRPWDPQGKRGTRREESPHSSGEDWDPQGKRGTRRKESPRSSGESIDWVRTKGLDLDDIRPNLKPWVNQGPGKAMNLTLEGQTLMNIVHGDTSTTPISR